jgi:hypothetical protein
MIDFLQPQYTASDTVGVLCPRTDDLDEFLPRIGQEGRNLGDNSAPNHQNLRSGTRTKQFSTRPPRPTLEQIEP